MLLIALVISTYAYSMGMVPRETAFIVALAFLSWMNRDMGNKLITEARKLTGEPFVSAVERQYRISTIAPLVVGAVYLLVSMLVD